MGRYDEQGMIGMPRGSMLRIDDGPGLLVYVREGELWLTEEGSREDHLLRDGQWFRIERGGAALAHALRRSAVSLSHATPSPARRVVLRRAGSAVPTVLYQRGLLSLGDVSCAMRAAMNFTFTNNFRRGGSK
jgi:hypothetical protein